MYENIAYYLIIGLLWALANAGGENQGHRIRLVLFWPVTLCAFLIGFIEAVINDDEENY